MGLATMPHPIKQITEPTYRKALSTKACRQQCGPRATRYFIEYAPLATGTGYVAPAVMLEFGARSTGEPSEPRIIRCDAAKHLQGVEFPTATPQVMRAERTFWEKDTAIHVFCAQGAFRGGD